MGASHTFAAVRREEKPFRLLWPVVGLGVVLIAGLGVLYAMFSSHREHAVAPTAPTVKAATPAPKKTSSMQSIDDEDPAAAAEKFPPPAITVDKKPEPEPETKPSEPEKPAAPAAPEVAAVPFSPPAPPAEKKPAGDPYMVPENKPFIDRDMFGAGSNKPKPAATATTPSTPSTPATPATPTPPKPAAVAPPPPPPPPATTVQNDVYVLFSGRKINAASTIDMGDSYGIKDTAGNFIKVKKADVSKIIKP